MEAIKNVGTYLFALVMVGVMLGTTTGDRLIAGFIHMLVDTTVMVLVIMAGIGLCHLFDKK